MDEAKFWLILWGILIGGVFACASLEIAYEWHKDALTFKLTNALIQKGASPIEISCVLHQDRSACIAVEGNRYSKNGD